MCGLGSSDEPPARLGLNNSFRAPGGDRSANSVITSYTSRPSRPAWAARFPHSWSRTQRSELPAENMPIAEVNMPGTTCVNT